jgi:hypothetical protein
MATRALEAEHRGVGGVIADSGDDGRSYVCWVIEGDDDYIVGNIEIWERQLERRWEVVW